MASNGIEATIFPASPVSGGGGANQPDGTVALYSPAEPAGVVMVKTPPGVMIGANVVPTPVMILPSAIPSPCEARPVE